MQWRSTDGGRQLTQQLIAEQIVMSPDANALPAKEPDFSWEGLRDQPWVGWRVLRSGRIVQQSEVRGRQARAATLQDYWRAEKDHLIESGGRMWTRVHCPCTDAQGRPTAKGLWSETEREALSSVVSARLAAAGPTNYGYHWVVDDYDDWVIGIDHRAQLDGAVLFEAPLHPKGHTHAIHATFVRATIFSSVWDSQHFGPGTVFRLAKFLNGASFQCCVFEGYVNFFAAKFQGAALFRHGRFNGDAAFQETEFVAIADFGHTRFLEIANFKQATFRGGMSFRSANFLDAVEFQAADIAITREGWEGAFFDATAKRLVNFTQREQFAAFALFDGVSLEGGFRMDETSFAHDVGFKQALARAGGTNSSRTALGQHATRNHRLAQLERGCRALKDAASKRNAHGEQQRFFRYELAARARRTDASPIARGLLQTYGAVSGYGTSILRPAVLLLLGVVAFASLYFGIATAAQTYNPFFRHELDLGEEAMAALRFSMRNVLRGLMPTASNAEKIWVETLTEALGPYLAPFIGLLVAAQAGWSVLMIFLIALAARRRFQMG